MKFTTTMTEGWRSHCLDWAKAKEPFELHGIAREHFPFCDALCAAHKGKYRLSFLSPVAMFTFAPDGSVSAKSPGPNDQ